MTYEEAISRCWLEVDLDAIRQNYRSCELMLTGTIVPVPVLKANAYGMDAVEVARALKAEGAQLFAVAAPAEAEQILREIPDACVLTMGYTGPDAAKRLIGMGQPLTVYSPANAKMISDAAAEVGRKAKVHIKVDTGLHRIGLEPETAAEEVLKVMAEGHIEIEGLFTHLAIHTKEMDMIQMDRLRRVLSDLNTAGVEVKYVHAMDSIGMVRYSKKCDRMNAARIGAWLYGVEPSGDKPCHALCPAKFRSRVSQVRDLKAGELIGYDDDHPLTKDSRIATVTAGYIDGTPRKGIDWCVEVRGQRAPVIGISCMDQLMCDVSDIPGVEEGDIVTFCGGIIDNEEYSRMGAFNHNEAWARIGRRVPRVFFENGQPVKIKTEL